MDWDKAMEKFREMIMGELRGELREFRASVTGELSGFRLAIESMNSWQKSMQQELADIRYSIDHTNNRLDESRTELLSRIDEFRVELKKEISGNTVRIDSNNQRIDQIQAQLSSKIDEINNRMDSLSMDVAFIKGELNKALSDKEVVKDILLRVERLEARVA